MNKEKHEKAFEEWSVNYWGINADPSEVEKMIWLAACEYMERDLSSRKYKPEKLSVKHSFSLFLADTKASNK